MGGTFKGTGDGGGAEECVSRSGSNRILPRKLKNWNAYKYALPCGLLSAHECCGEGIFTHWSWCGSVIKTQKEVGKLSSICMVYSSSPKLYWSVEKGRKSGQA